MTMYNKYELANLIGTRALQISQGAPLKIKLSEKQLQEIKYNPIEIAKLELEKDVIPLKVVRELPEEVVEEEEVTEKELAKEI